LERAMTQLARAKGRLDTPRQPTRRWPAAAPHEEVRSVPGGAREVGGIGANYFSPRAWESGGVRD
jgi:hypothetical protein